MFSNESNLTSDSYRGVNVTASILIPQGVTSAPAHYRPIEIQLAESENRNEKLFR